MCEKNVENFIQHSSWRANIITISFLHTQRCRWSISSQRSRNIPWWARLTFLSLTLLLPHDVEDFICTKQKISCIHFISTLLQQLWRDKKAAKTGLWSEEAAKEKAEENEKLDYIINFQWLHAMIREKYRYIFIFSLSGDYSPSRFAYQTTCM